MFYMAYSYLNICDLSKLISIFFLMRIGSRTSKIKPVNRVSFMSFRGEQPSFLFYLTFTLSPLKLLMTPHCQHYLVPNLDNRSKIYIRLYFSSPMQCFLVFLPRYIYSIHLFNHQKCRHIYYGQVIMPDSEKIKISKKNLHSQWAYSYRDREIELSRGSLRQVLEQEKEAFELDQSNKMDKCLSFVL